VISESEKLSIVRSAAGGDVSAEFDKFINLVFTNKREHLLRYIAVMYRHLYQKNNNIGICNLVTAVPISDEIEKNIIQLISEKTHRKVELNKSVNPEILGGFVFELNYNRLDASVASQLKRIRLQFETINNR
jgi:F-type H+-transporting ATPase subunit delta